MGVLIKPIMFLNPPAAPTFTITNKFAADVNSSTTGSNKASATVDCGTVTTDSILIVSQFGSVDAAGTTPWVTPVKSSGTATIGSAVLIGSQARANARNAEAVTAVWYIPVTSGGTLVLTTDDSIVSVGWGCVVDEVTGHDTSTPITGAVTRTWQSDSGGTNQAAADSTLTATPSVDDIAYAVADWDGDTGTNTASAGTGWTETQEVSPDAAYTIGIVQTRTGSASTNVVWPTASTTGSTYSLGAIAFIIKKAP
jgi:hypothetical protein